MIGKHCIALISPGRSRRALPPRPAKIPLKMQPKKICDFNEKLTRERDGRVYWFKRVEALAGVVTE